jgi:hypothetical protein
MLTLSLTDILPVLTYIFGKFGCTIVSRLETKLTNDGLSWSLHHTSCDDFVGKFEAT